MNPHLQRALMLLQQERYEQAVEELQQALISDPNDAYAISLLAISWSNLEQYAKAEQAAAEAISLAPDSAFSFYAASVVSLARSDLKSAKTEIIQAIQIDPYDPDHFAQLALIEANNKNWRQAIEQAEKGLELDPEHVDCSNFRALALTKSGRREEAGASIHSTLQHAPEDAFSHANMGWELLHKGQAKQSLTHFKEALRLQPEMEYARVGVVEAMKGQFFIYRIFLSWLLFCSQLKGKYLFGIIIGGYVGYRICISLLNSNPTLKWILIPLIGLYLGFVLMTWVAMPLFNLLLRTSKFGRMVLSREETRTSTWVGIALFSTVICLLGWMFSGSNNWLSAAISSALTIPALSSYYSSDEGWPRTVHGLLLLVLLILCSIFLIGMSCSYLIGGPIGRAFEVVALMADLPFLLLAIASQFGVNFLVMAKPRKGTQAAKTARIVGGSLVAVLLSLFFLAAASVLYVAIISPDFFLNEKYEQFNLAPPLRINYEPTESAKWSSDTEIRNGTVQLSQLGFQSCGDFTVVGLSTTSNRFFLHDRGKWIAHLKENPVTKKLTLSLVAQTVEGQHLEVTNDTKYFAHPEGWQVLVEAGSASELFEKAIQLQLRKKLRQFTTEQVPQFVEDEHARNLDFLIARGGYTDEELGAAFKKMGVKLSGQEISIFQSRWREDTGENVEKHMLAVFIQEHPKYANQTDRLICATRYTQQLPFITRGSSMKLSQVTGHIEENKKFRVAQPNQRRQIVEEFCSRRDDVTKLGSLESPVAADFYLVSHPSEILNYPAPKDSSSSEQ